MEETKAWTPDESNSLDDDALVAITITGRCGPDGTSMWRHEYAKQHANKHTCMMRFKHCHHWLRMFCYTDNLVLWEAAVPDGHIVTHVSGCIPPHLLCAIKVRLHSPQPVPFVVWRRGLEEAVVMLRDVPVYFHTPTALEAALRGDAANLKHMRRKDRTEARCLVALRTEPAMFLHVPQELSDSPAFRGKALRANARCRAYMEDEAGVA